MDCLKILVSAYACRPGTGSEPGVGWNVVREIAKYHQVWVLTRKDNQTTIDAELTNNPIPEINFVYYDLPWSQWWNRDLQLVYLHYYCWQIGVYFLAQKLHQKVNFDLVHHVTYVRYSSPSFLSLLSIPFIWGPVGGGEFAPKAFWKDFSLRGKVYEVLRSLACWIGEKDPFVQITAQRSILAQATTDDTAKRLYKIGSTNVRVFSQLGLSEEEIVQLSQPKTSSDLAIKFVSIGRLLHWKGFHLGLRAFAQADLPNDSEYWILGDGPEKKQLQFLAQKLEITAKVKFWGSLPREEVLHRLKECQVLVHPSMHESGGLVCLEAMAASIPVICLDLGGPAIQVTEKTGIKVPAYTPEQVVGNLAKAMTRLATNSKLRLYMGQAACKRVQDMYNWQSKGKQLAQLYEEILKCKT